MKLEHPAGDRDKACLHSSSKTVQAPLIVTVRQEHDLEPINIPPTPTTASALSHVRRFENEELFKAWNKHRKP